MFSYKVKEDKGFPIKYSTLNETPLALRKIPLKLRQDKTYCTSRLAYLMELA